jgi:hypothetical protein
MGRYQGPSCERYPAPRDRAAWALYHGAPVDWRAGERPAVPEPHVPMATSHVLHRSEGPNTTVVCGDAPALIYRWSAAPDQTILTCHAFNAIAILIDEPINPTTFVGPRRVLLVLAPGLPLILPFGRNRLYAYNATAGSNAELAVSGHWYEPTYPWNYPTGAQ